MSGPGKPGRARPGPVGPDARGATPAGAPAGDAPTGFARLLDSSFATFRRRLRGGDLGPVPIVLGLLAIWLTFQLLDENFLSPRNLSGISVDIVGTGMIAVGVVFVLLIGQIDLSVASVSGLAAAVFAVLNVLHGVPEWAAVLAAVLCGTAVGALHGFVFARIGVPAFVVTLAGVLGWHGAMLYVLGSHGTVNFDDQGLVAQLTSFYFSDIAAAYGLAALGTAGYFLAAYRTARRRRAAGVPARTLGEIAVRTAVLALTVFAAAYVLNRFRGLPLALLLFLVVVAGLDYVVRRTRYGRRVVALGSGVEAARRAGVNVVRVRISVLMISGTMAAVGGLFIASRISSASQTAGSANLLMNAIAAAVIGGTSLYGGHGRTWSALLGMLVIQSIASGMALLGIQTALQFMITGGVLLIAVIIDTMARHAQRAHGRV